MRCFSILLIIFCCTIASSETISILPDKGLGSIERSIGFRVVHQGANGAFTSQRHQAFPKCGQVSGRKYHYLGNWKFPESVSPVKFDISYDLTNPNRVGLNYHFKASDPVSSKVFALQLEIPSAEFIGRPVAFDGKTVSFPEKRDKYLLFSGIGIRRIELPLREGVLAIIPSSPILVNLIDQRKESQKNFFLNLSFLDKNIKSFTQAELSFEFQVLSGGLTPLPISEAANSRFADEVPGDRKGGWTDQGSLLDLRLLESGRLETPYGDFNVLGDQENNGKSCIVLGGASRSYLPKQAFQTLKERNIRTLALLHAIAWPGVSGEVGTITARFSDGGEQKISVFSGRDVGNWWNPNPVVNGMIPWKTRNDENDVGLYLSFFPLPSRPVESLQFDSSGRSVWMIAGIAGSDLLLSLPRQSEYTFTRNKEWRPFIADRSIKAGSALDFSFLLDAPAGKHGFLEVRNGKFRFEKQEAPIRFYGANLCGGACYLEPAEAEQLAERLSRIGYNAIRLHHYDRDYVRQDTGNSITVDEAQREKFEYLIAALKKHGIYITIDLFSNRNRIPGEFASLPKLKEVKGYKLAAMLVPEVNANLKAFARQVLTHVNPHTGLSLVEDPVLAGVVGINENMIISLYDDCTRLSKDVVAVYNREFDEWSQKQNLQITADNRQEHFNRFLYDVYERYWSDMTKFLRGIGLRVPLSEQNHRQPPLAYMLREKYDYVDNHIYWDHPQWIGPVKWKHPAQIRNTSVMAGGLWPIRMLGPSRLFGKPFTVSEFDFCYPNEFRAEGAVLMGAYAAFQDWDGLFRFDYAAGKNSLFAQRYLSSFCVVNDPIRLLGERIAMALFVRGDLPPAPNAIPVVVKPGEFERGYIESYSRPAQKLTFLGRTGSVAWRDNHFSPVLPDGTIAVYPESPTIRIPADIRLFDDKIEKEISGTGGLKLDLKEQTFIAASSKSEALIIPAGKQLTGTCLTARSVKGFGVVSAIALDGRELSGSERILLLHLTDLRTEGICYLSEENKVILKDAPRGNNILGRHGIMRTELKATGNYRLYALDHDGSRLAEIPVASSGNKLQITLDTFCLSEKVVWAYELVKLN